ncbi:MAG TPA: hypothetical protein VE981_11195, partial [Planctomycetota bacterium]|nr:hypothetical protein [Planctomycetota bacterium]
MAGFGVEADGILKRLKGLVGRKPAADFSPAPASLHVLYETLGLTFPGFDGATNPQAAVRKALQAGLRRYAEAGAVRTPAWPFQRLYDAVLEEFSTGRFQGTWFNAVHRIGQRCGNEPRDFVERIQNAGSRARKAARTALKTQLLETRLQSQLLEPAVELVSG